MDHNELFRHGSARFATEADLRASGLLKNTNAGSPIGFWGNRLMRFETDGPCIIIAGSGAGKLVTDLVYKLTLTPGRRKVWIDMKPEITKVVEPAFAHYKEHLHAFNPMQSQGIPHVNLNPLEALTASSPSLQSDSAFIMGDMIASTGGDNGAYFEEKARIWAGDLTTALAVKDGSVSLPSLYRLICAIESDPVTWGAHLEFMLESPSPGLRRTAGEMLYKQQESPKEFGGIVGTIYNNFAWLDEPRLMQSLEEAEFSLTKLIDPDQVHHLSMMLTPTTLRKSHPLVRATLSAINLMKENNPDSPPLDLYIEECAQLKKYNGLQDLVSYSRGLKIKPTLVFQDLGQIKQFHGQHSLSTFIGSSVERRIYGVRDGESAEYFSRMAGTATQEYNDEFRQQAAAKKKREAAAAFLNEDDPITAAMNYQHFQEVEHTRSKMARRLITPDELMKMGTDEALIFLAGDIPQLVKVNRFYYFRLRMMAGLYGPNFFHPPIDRVLIMTRLGPRWRKLITEPVPEAFADYPQYRNGTWSYVDGFRPSCR